jgi:restriction system protein
MQIQAQREAERSQIRSEKQAEKEAKQRFMEERIEETEDRNDELGEKLKEINEILKHTLSVNDTVNIDELRIREPFLKFSPPPSLAESRQAPNKDNYLKGIKEPGAIIRMIPGTRNRYFKAMQEADRRYQEDTRRHQEVEEKRMLQLEEEKKNYEENKAAYELKVKQRDVEIDEFQMNYKAGDPNAIVTYCNVVLERSEYPEEFPQEFRIAYVPESKEIVIDYELPPPVIIPKTSEFKYIKAKDSIEEKPRKPSEIKELYQDLVASIALRTCHELLEADQENHINVVVFNGFVQTVDASTGRDIRPYLISVRVTKDNFLQLDLARVDKKACLRNLGAFVSPRPDEVQPVKPIIEFDMVDKRFVEQSDVLSDLESRPNLRDLNPFEFENLVSNLFQQLGLESKLTRSSRDGGVDAVAFDIRPVIGGKVVIQAKRYKNTVGVSAVRDLYGTMMNEGANKGILVTTSGFGPDAYEFSKDKPIELIDGGKLLFLLDQVGVKARIIFPDDWKGN